MLWTIFILALAGLLSWAICLVGLYVSGRRGAARALATFLPDSIVLVRRLLSDPAVPRPRKLAIAALLAYLAFPIDLVPDFIPVLGQLDDAILAALTLRFVLRGVPPGRLAELWPGPPEGLAVISRLASACAPSGRSTPAQG